MDQLTFQYLMEYPNSPFELYSKNSEELDKLIENLKHVNGRALQYILKQLYQNGVTLKNVKVPTWFYTPEIIPVTNLITVLRYGFPPDFGGNLFLWWQADKPFNDILLDVMINLGINLNMINYNTGETLLQKVILLENENNVEILLKHRVPPDDQAVKTALDTYNQTKSGKSLRIIRKLKIYGGLFPPTNNQTLIRYFTSASKYKCEYYSNPKTYFEIYDLQDKFIEDVILNKKDSSVEQARKNVTKTQNGLVLAWPYYLDVSQKTPICPEKPWPSIAYPPSDTEIMLNAISDLPDITPEIKSPKSPKMGIASPTPYYPDESKTFLI